MNALTISGIKVRSDGDGRYSLNDLHKAAGGESRHQPAFFFRRPEIVELTAAIVNSAPAQNIDPVASTPGRNGGTFVCKQLVYAYAMWVNPIFHLHVIEAYDAQVMAQLADRDRIAARQSARLEAPDLTDAIKHRREVQGKPVAHYHFSNEFDLVNRVALGKSAKEFRAAHGIGQDGQIRDHLTVLEIRCVQALQRANTTMIDMGLPFEQRKTELHKIYVTRHAPGLLSEVKRIEA